MTGRRGNRDHGGRVTQQASHMSTSGRPVLTSAALSGTGQYKCMAPGEGTPTAYGGSQARGRIGAVASNLHHSHSNVGSEPHRPPTPQLTAMPDP